MSKIIELWGNHPPVLKNLAIRHLKANVPDLPLIESQQYVGIEIEIENWIRQEKEISRVWQSKEDGSLRNNGIEWVTTPIVASQAPFALYHLLHDIVPEDCCFSPRTSVHVHLNMQQWDETQVKNLVLWYVLFEPLFYRFTGRGRQKNIYCVPLMDVDVLRNFIERSLPQIVTSWSKYAGLNLCPLVGYGTVEFRHMHGTFDYVKLSRWVRILCKLADFVFNNENVFHRNTLAHLTEYSNYPKLLHDIFGEDVQYMKFKSVEDLQTTMHQVKLAFTSINTTNQLVKDRKNDSLFFSK
jgi:hypothetical protein